jgi:hypothetical protein
MIRLGFVALPGIICSASGALGLLVGHLAESSPSTADAYAVFVAALIFVVAAGWAVKEFYRPTEARMPDWLK